MYSPALGSDRPSPITVSSAVATPTSRRGLRVGLAGGREGHWRRLHPTVLEDLRDPWVGDVALPALVVPVEDGEDPVGVFAVAEDLRAPRSVLLSELCALGREDLPEAVEVVDLRGSENHQRLLQSDCPPSNRSYAGRVPRRK